MVPEEQKPAPVNTAQKEPTQDEKDMAALSYVWGIAIFMLFAKRESAYIQFHARQGVVIFLATILAFFLPLIDQLAIAICIAAMFWGFFNAAKGTMNYVPFFGRLSEGKFNAKESVDSIKSMFNKNTESSKPQPKAEEEKKPSSDDSLFGI